jgi:hypothetical protein
MPKLVIPGVITLLRHTFQGRYCLVRLEGNFTLDFPELVKVSSGSHPVLFAIKQATLVQSKASIF